MAINKIGLTKLGLKKNTNLTTIDWNSQIIEIKEYLPIQEKLELIGKIVNESLDENNFANPARLQIFMILEIMYTYTNINFTEKQKEDFLGLYDLLISSGLWDVIAKKLYELGEFQIISDTVHTVIDEIYKYRVSALGILSAIQEDYQKLNLDADSIRDKLADEKNLALLKKVVTELG